MEQYQHRLERTQIKIYVLLIVLLFLPWIGQVIWIAVIMAIYIRPTLVIASRLFSRNALALLFAMVSASAATADNDSQSANSIMPGCNAWIVQLNRGNAALGSNAFLAVECFGIVGTIL
jgi:hypothetical protein